MIDSAHEHVDAIVKKAYNNLLNNIILKLREIPQNAMQSGADSPLLDIWEEICSQVQVQESIFWEKYLVVIESIVETEVNKLDPILLRIMWLETDGYIEWDDDKGDFENHNFTDDVSKKTIDLLLELAANYKMDNED
jgi:hypothetical protein